MGTVTAISLQAQEEDLSAHRKIGVPTLKWSYHGSKTEFNLGSAQVSNRTNALQPRHRHIMEQIRYVYSGSMTYGRNRTANAGDVVYFPEAVAYGPVTYEAGEMYILQWPGTSEHGLFINYEEWRGVVRDLLQGGGEFDHSKGGLFRHPDGRYQDGYEAVAEQYLGHPIEYPVARYSEQVLLRPERFAAVEVPSAPGVSVRHLGYFNEVGPNIKVIEMAAGSALPSRFSQSQQVWLVIDGEVSYEGVAYGRKAMFHVSPGAERSTAVATQGSRILAIHLCHPTLPHMPFSEY